MRIDSDLGFVLGSARRIEHDADIDAASPGSVFPVAAGSFIPSQDSHPFGDGKRALSACAVIPGAQLLGLRHRRGKLRFQVSLRFF
jgi:hypothetical protein